MKILYIITGLGQGGAERVVCDLADSMSIKGHIVKIEYLTGDVSTKPKSDTIELIPINLTGIKTLPLAYFRIFRIIKSYRPDVVHTHMVHANILTRMVKLITPINKLVSTAHNSNEGGLLRMLGYRITHKLSDVTTNVSNTAVRSFEEKHAVPLNSMKVIYNGVNFDNFSYNSTAKNRILKELELESSVKLILAVGRFSLQKNYYNLIEAINILKNNYYLPFKLIIAGDGELRSEIENQILKLDLEENVILLGRRSDIPDLMSAADVFVLSSDYEGLPTVLIEALGCQCQIVSTNVSGVNEIVGNFGEIVPTNKPESLANAIAKSLTKKNKNIEGRNFAKEKFDLELISEQWLYIYHEA